MGEGTKVPYAHHTFNIVWGCDHVSEGCAHCYAEAWAKRTGFDVWGKRRRRAFGERYWKQPLMWQRKAAAAGERHRILCSSMADVLEDHDQVHAERRKLPELVEATPDLDWMLFTKRVENADSMLGELWGDNWPHNVWLISTMENQRRYDERIDHLLRSKANVVGISVEPLLGFIDVPHVVESGTPGHCRDIDGGYWHLPGKCSGAPNNCSGRCCQRALDWVIVGGESGANARPMDLHWATSIVRQCKHAGVPCYVKQLGSRPVLGKNRCPTTAAKGEDVSEWPAELCVQQLPQTMLEAA
jgi:protein gp37